MNDWIAKNITDLEAAWNEWARKETEIFADPLDFYEFCYVNRGKDFRAEFKKRVRRGVGRAA